GQPGGVERVADGVRGRPIRQPGGGRRGEEHREERCRREHRWKYRVSAMSAVVEFDAVSVRRGQSHLLDDLSLTVRDGEHGAVLGPNGAGKTTLRPPAGSRMPPASGPRRLLDEPMGRVDVFELRPRIGFTSQALAQQTPGSEILRDLVLTAAYGVVGRWTEEY